MTHWFEKMTMAVLALAAVVIAVVLVRREFIVPNRSDVPSRAPPQFVKNWQDVLKAAVVLGDAAAPVVVVEFMDLECPYCKTFNSVTRGLRRKHGDRIALAVVHYPLEGLHKFARPAAGAAECAGEQGQFEQMLNAVYDKQDSLGLKSWTSYAQDAGVRDTIAYAKCLSRSERSPRIDAGLEMARRFGVEGTPTLIINGWLLKTPPSENELNKAVETFLAGKSPYSS